MMNALDHIAKLRSDEGSRNELLAWIASSRPVGALTAPTGDCFQQAGHEMIEHWLRYDDDRLRLVHAEVEGSDGSGRFDHAWCELSGVECRFEDGSVAVGTVVIDNTQPSPESRILPRDLFYTQVRPTELQRFTFWEMIACIRFFGHDGPWDRGVE